MPAIILILQYAYIYHLNLLKANLTLNLSKAISAVINSFFLYPNLIKNPVQITFICIVAGCNNDKTFFCVIFLAPVGHSTTLT